MYLEKEECNNAINVLQETKQALLNKDFYKLKLLSNRTIHSSCSYQDAGSITSTILIYALNKLVEREDYLKIPGWNKFVKKFNSTIDLAISALNKNDSNLYAEYMQQARKTIESISVDLKPYIEEVLKKAAINKGSKLYEHGISLEQTARLLGISRWELSEYISQKVTEIRLNRTISTKKRAQMALEFLS